MIMPSGGKPWTKRDERRLVKYRQMGMLFDEIGELLDRTEKAIRSRWKVLGMAVDRRFTAEQIDRVKELHGKMPAAAIAAEIGRSRLGVHQLVRRLGLPRLTRVIDWKPVERYIRARHGEEWSDSEIAAGWTAKHPGVPLDRRLISERRVLIGLPAHGPRSTRYRRRVAKTTREQLRRAGLPSIGCLRVKAYEAFAVRQGWPMLKRPRAVQIMNLLYERGPQTRPAIAEAIGMKWGGTAITPASRNALHGNGPGGTYLAELMRMGLVVRLGRCVQTGPKRQQRSFLYAIPAHITRQLPRRTG